MSRRILCWAASVCLVLAAGAAVRADDVQTVGRVKVVPVGQASGARWGSVEGKLEARFSPTGDKLFPDQRLISLRPRAGDPDRFDATIFDYRTERSYEVVVDGSGNELARTPSLEQPARSMAELADAYAIVGANPAYREALARGELQLYEPMPPVTVDGVGRRLVNVGVMSVPQAAGTPLARNEIVSVDIPQGRIVHYDGNAPDTSRAALFACGPGSSSCGAAVGSCSTSYQVTWPSTNPVWQFTITHPSCTSSVQGDGTGLLITDAYYRGKLVLTRGEVPVLNVLYGNNTCGPYRDWLTSEDCFQATGTDVGSGVRVTTAPPSTLCESQNDSGNFKGTAIYDQGDAVWLMTETNAGWYRYVMEWRFHLDGTIEPIFGFGATSNGCTCNLHYHHAYWRLEWAIDGQSSDLSSGITTLERHRSGASSDTFDPVTAEGSFVRIPAEGTKDTFRITNPQTGDGYIIQPGDLDGTASGDSYGKWDLTALALNSGQINDPNSDTSINVTPWVSGESLGTTKRLVTWYHASYTHDDPSGTHEPCELVGPKLVPVVPCSGTVSLDRNVYSCSASVNVNMNDFDLAGRGTTTVSVFSGAEAASELLTLTESPASSGRFTGTIVTAATAAVPGDGKISVADGDTVHVQYLDESACGTPNVTVEKTAPIDCVAPAIQNVQSSLVTGSSARVTWATNESANSTVSYGLVAPPGSSSSVPTPMTAHQVDLSGLAECTPYVYSVSSTDGAGNVASDSNGGTYYGFTTGKSVQPVYPSADTPKPIPDVATTTSPLVVPDTKIIQDVNVKVNLNHTYDSDIAIALIGPNNVTVNLSLNHGSSGDNYTDTIFDDQAAAPIGSGSAPFTGSFVPDQPLSVFNGIAANGTWTLRVIDSIGQDSGTLNSWSLNLTFPNQSCGPHAVFNFQAPIADTCGAGGAGNNNAVWDAGETVQFKVNLTNDGSMPLTGVSATVVPTTPGVSMVNATASYPGLAIGASADSNAPYFTAKLSSSLACNTSVSFQVNIHANEGTWTGSFNHVIGTIVSGNGTPLDVNFSGGIPATWTVVDGGSGSGAAATWTTANPGARVFTAPIVAPVAIVDSDNAGSSGNQDEQLITPALNLSTATTVQLEFDQWFRWFSGGGAEVADVDVRSSVTGGAWVNVWRSPNASVPSTCTNSTCPTPEHRVINITGQAAGAANAQVRFHYYNGHFDWWWQVDNAKITFTAPGGCNQTVCPGPPTAVKPVPDGSFGTAFTASRLDVPGTQIGVTWDVSTCASTGYHILYGNLASVPALTPAGSACGIGASGSYSWTGVPAGDLWYVVVADDASSTEGSWGLATSGERGGTSASGQCSMSTRDNSGSCP